MAFPSFLPINAGLLSPQEGRSQSPPLCESDAIPIFSAPTSSSRETIIEAAERLACPRGKRRRIAAGKAHTRDRRPREQTQQRGDKVSNVDDLHQTAESHPATRTVEGAHSDALSRKTVERLNVFRFEPTCEAATGTSASGHTAGQDSGLTTTNTCVDTVGRDEEGHDNEEGTSLKQSPDSTKLTQATLRLPAGFVSDLDLKDEKFLAGMQGDASPSPFETDDFDFGSLGDAFEAAEADLPPEGPENLDVESAPQILPQPGSAESDFGSDPFGPDDADDADDAEHPDHQPQSHSLHNEDCFDATTSQSRETSFTQTPTDPQKMPPPSYQTPQKTPPKSPTATRPPTNHNHAITPAFPPSHHPPISPFLRPTFPTPVPTHSPIANLTPTTRILTCFRIAEYLRAISRPNPNPNPSIPPPPPPPANLLIELYAHITSSTRHGPNQHFTFADLFFPHRPPHLHGTCSTWQGSDLYEHDTRIFLGGAGGDEEGEGGGSSDAMSMMCRAIVRPGRGKRQQQRGAGMRGSAQGQQGQQEQVLSPAAGEVEVLSIWRASWEDVEYVRGIVGA